MRRATIRQDRATKTWTVRRPTYGFSPHDEVKHGFPTQRAALRWTDRTLRPHGTPVVLAERSWTDDDHHDPDTWVRATAEHGDVHQRRTQHADG